MSDTGTTDVLEYGHSSHRLDSIELLAGIPPDSMRELEAKCRWLEYGPDHTVLEREDASHDVFFIARGSVRVINYLGNDREVALADLHEGDHFGELSAVDSRERSARVVGNEYCVIAALSRSDFLDMLRRFPEVALRLLDHFASIIRAMNQRVSSLTALTPRQRIYTELLRMAEPNPAGDGSWMIDVVPHHNELASWAGTEKQEVATAIGALVRDGVIERRNRSYFIKDHPRLKVLSSMS